MKVFDLHCHHILKTLFSNKYSAWESIPVSGKLVDDIIASQSSFNLVVKNPETNLLCVTLHPMETGMLDQFILKLMPVLTDAFDKNLIQSMIDGTYPYQKVLAKELENLFAIPAVRPKDFKPLHQLQRMSDYIINLNEKIYIIYNLEGGHIFYNEGNSDKDIDKIISDFENFVTKGDKLILYVTPTHLTHNIFINHAYGNKIFPKGKLLPKGDGISAAGHKFLDKITGTNLLIDIKHMSLVSRQDFYKNPDWNKKPLVASHVGLTGISWNDKLDKKYLDKIKKATNFVKIRYKKPKGLLPETWFNPSSINMYNEDVINVLQTKGLIGINIDIRILGGDRDLLGYFKNTEKEFISPQEFEKWTSGIRTESLNDDDYEFPYEDKNYWINDEVNDEFWDDEDIRDHREEINFLAEGDIEKFNKNMTGGINTLENERVSKDRSDEHFLFFINQVLKVVQLGNSLGNIDPWKHICIGSDFDGMIKAIDTCKDVTQFDKLASMMINELPNSAQTVNIPLPRSAESLVEDIMFNNALKFITEHFTPKL